MAGDRLEGAQRIEGGQPAAHGTFCDGYELYSRSGPSHFFSSRSIKSLSCSRPQNPGSLPPSTPQPPGGPMNDFGLRLAQSALAVASFLAILALTGFLHV